MTILALNADDVLIPSNDPEKLEDILRITFEELFTWKILENLEVYKVWKLRETWRKIHYDRTPYMENILEKLTKKEIFHRVLPRWPSR